MGQGISRLLLAQKTKQYRKKNNLTVEALARQAGVSHNTINKAERGIPMRPTTTEVMCLAVGLMIYCKHCDTAYPLEMFSTPLQRVQEKCNKCVAAEEEAECARQERERKRQWREYRAAWQANYNPPKPAPEIPLQPGERDWLDSLGCGKRVAIEGRAQYVAVEL